MPGRFRVAVVGAVLCMAVPCLFAQNFAPPAAQKVDEADLKTISQKIERLDKAISLLRRLKVRDPWLADIEIYHQAAKNIVQHNEFFDPAYAKWTLEALDRGLLRARLFSEGDSPWMNTAGYSVIHAFRSRIDDSLQPYAVVLPADYSKDPTKKWRVDVVLHGRDAKATEVKFLHRFNGEEKQASNDDFVRIEIWGRGNNAYRWAGETDVFEAIDHFFALEQGLGRGTLLDRERIVLRGFSMGGAGTWHLGLHYPDRWRLIAPGAGFTTTHGYSKGIPDKLPDYQEACLHIYDAVDYALNAFNVPIVAYSGDIDPQKQAAVNIEERLKQLGLSMTHLIAPDTKHDFPAEWQAKAQALYAKAIEKDRPTYPNRIRFVTYTLRYPGCNWVRVLGLDKHYQETLVDADRTEDGFNVTTKNVRALQLSMPFGALAVIKVMIDKQEAHARPWISQGGESLVYLVRRDGQWVSVMPQRMLTTRAQQPQKMPGLQGPIDDAFRETFLCVRGTGKGWHKGTAQYADANLQRFESEWAKYFRGQLPIKDDIDVNDTDIAGKHLILFGDPASNYFIDQVLDGLPLQWSETEIELAGKKYAAGEHVPVLIFPNPLNPSRYVVLNSGHTFHEAELRDTNAQLYPRLGDFAMLRLQPTVDNPLNVEVQKAGLFDEFWKISE